VINPDTGELLFSVPGVVLGPSLKRFETSEASALSKARGIPEHDRGFLWSPGELPWRNQLFIVTVHFVGWTTAAIQVNLSASGPITSWETWSEESELRTKAAHDALLSEVLGERRSFSWGNVSSAYDQRSCNSSIFISYRASPAR
jgi:hypothetical protein